MANRYEILTSEALMALVAGGDHNAFHWLVDRHKEMVFRTIYRFVGKQETANDLAQDVFLRIWRSAAQYQPTAKFTTWLFTITANVCKSELQSLWRRKINLIGSFWSSDDTDASGRTEAIDPLPSPEDAALQSEQGHQILAAIRSLPRNQRLALVLKRYEELSYQEIATALGCSVPAVESLLVRAKANLQKKLAPLRK